MSSFLVGGFTIAESIDRPRFHLWAVQCATLKLTTQVQSEDAALQVWKVL